MDLSPVLRLLAKRRLAKLQRIDPVATQERTLLGLVGRARDTRFGRDHDFARIRSVADFQARVPLRQFEDFWTDYFKALWPLLDNVSWPGRIPFFAKTSGTTTGRTKYIPITREIIKSNERTGFDLMSFHLAQHPRSRPLAGRSFIVAGSTALEEVAPGVFAGDVSGINTKLTPFWVRPNIYPTADLALISGWDEKLDKLARGALDLRISMMSGMCNWLLVMLDRIAELKAERGLRAGPTLPDLQLLIHGGVPMELYRERLMAHLGGAPVEARELYPTSEGFIACADRGPGEGLRMMLDNDLFLELVPLAEIESKTPTRHWAATIQPDIDYALVLSNNAGLFGYVLGDVVRFLDTAPPRFLIMGRIAQKLSPFGEHLIGAEIEQAVQSAARELGFAVAEYTVGPVLPATAGGRGYHVYIMETSDTVPAQAVAHHLDRVLREENYDYECQRAGDKGVLRPVVHFVAPGTFAGWMRAKNKLGGQNKVPRITAKAVPFAQMAAELGVAVATAARSEHVPVGQ
ncbi:MAG: GH3 auxin-responsive promoter family protein [Alphaproteobacteria bacterium]|nr:GH3 auxin-responsive promoter family protein [Alphaproteobacteria bacterium]